MGYFIKDIFWIKKQVSKFVITLRPIIFNDDYTGFMFLDKNQQVDLSFTMPSFLVKETIDTCNKQGATNLINESSKNVDKNAIIYCSRSLYLKALLNGTFVTVPDDVKSFTYPNGQIDFNKFNEFFEHKQIERSSLITYRASFTVCSTLIEPTIFNFDCNSIEKERV